MKLTSPIRINPAFPALMSIFLLSSCGQSESHYGIDDFYSVEKIDTHVHINTDHPAWIDQARNDNMRLITVNVDAGRVPVSEQKAVAVRLQNRHPELLHFVTSFSLEGWNETEEWQNRTIDYLRSSFEEGARGVKVWKNIGMEHRDPNGDFVMIDDPRFDPVMSYIADRGMPLYGHIGEPRNCWLPLEEMTVANDRDYFERNPQYHMYLHPDYPSYEEIIESRNRLLDRNPELMFFGAHLGSMEWSLEMMADHLDRYPNMVLGMAHRVPHIQYLARHDRQAVREFFITYQDRLLYSTDLAHRPGADPEEVRLLAEQTWREDWEFFVTDNEMSVWQVDGEFRGLQLPKEVIDKLYRKNAERFFPGL